MLISFGVSNLLSFKNKVLFSLLPGKSQLHKNHITTPKPFGILRGAVFYGANAAGKSNFFDAIYFFTNMISQGVIPQFLAHNQFKTGLENNVTTFEITFQINARIYNYSFDITPQEVLKEKLIRLYKTSETEEVIFERNGLNVQLGKVLQNSANDTNWYHNRTFQKNMLFLTKLKFDGIRENKEIIKGSEFILDVHDFFSKISLCKADSVMRPDILFRLFKLEDFRKFLLDLLQKADIGITDIKWVDLPENEANNLWQSYVYMNPVFLNMPIEQTLTENNAFIFRDRNSFYAIYVKNNKRMATVLKTFHWNNIPFDLIQESSGTNRLIELSLAFYKLLDDERVCFIDELDNSLHPNLTKFLLQQFLESKKQSQLIVSMHDINLLDNKIWRPDEVWFVEKDPEGASDIYSLNQFRPRFDKKIMNDYCEGKYGAIPLIGRLRV